jgi:hypothetical protein
LYPVEIPNHKGADHGDEHGAKAGQEGATAETGGGREAPGRCNRGKPARPCAPGCRGADPALLLARGATSHYLAFSVFLIDTFCLGIKDVMFDSIESEAFESYMAATDAGSPMVSVDPGYARKLLRDLAGWSQSIGFAPHRDFAAVERLFGDVSADASDAVFQFGRDGKPVYMPGPSETAPQMRRRIEQLQKYLGDNGFETAA